MKCPYCGKEMTAGKVCSDGFLYWKEPAEPSERLNDEDVIVNRMIGDRVSAWKCGHCSVILISGKHK